MSQNVKVNRYLEFSGDAAQEPNTKGDMSPVRMTSVDWYDQTTLNTTNDYTQTLGGTLDAGALSAGGVPGLTLTTGTGDQEVSFLGTALIYDITQKPAMETKIKIVDVSGTFVFWGFSDANTETTPAATIDGAGGTLAAAATDAAGFLCDAEYNTSGLYFVSTTDGATIQVVDTGIDWADNASHVLKVAIDASGNARGYVDGKQVGYLALAVSDVPLCEIINYGTRANDSSNVVYKRYLKKWQDIP